ncbi:hypothetical protein J7E50_02765 [Pedobacter sp. ISL-68]|uniref:hypothetical protein n=1 Tax=unclassified Pedobacter TaxID=2628915 RepID=UPI001BE8AE64|nr:MULTISPECIES: hypothetical protein [unclassified Pedobacter]MBT2560142.1 hypothetical protein [Pedobacter sp. ISL-64]MBT2589121.1 hypothetical protein [Pedobacter sp. ISL-68]
MKTVVYFIFTCFISTGAMLGALNMKNPFPLFAIAFGIWALFLWGCDRRAKKAAHKRTMERAFQDFVRMKKHHRHF